MESMFSSPLAAAYPRKAQPASASSAEAGHPASACTKSQSDSKFGLAGNGRSFMFTRTPLWIIGFGDLGRKLRALIAPFRNPVSVYDPWLPDDLIRSFECTPVGIENQGFIGKREFELMQPGAAFLLMSRAAVVDFPEFLRQVRSGRIIGATDVFPKEPVDADDPVRSVEGLLLSAHRTGGMIEALHQIRRMTVADAELILRGLPPQLCRRADPAVACRLRSMPVGTR
jgi:phosphoglycerate dehydrogenase-like enzyme